MYFKEELCNAILLAYLNYGFTKKMILIKTKKCIPFVFGINKPHEEWDILHCIQWYLKLDLNL